MNERITGAEVLMRGLVAEGVDRVFGYPGGAIMPVYDKLFDFTSSITHILTRHEQGAIHAAQGYARVSGRTGVVIVTSGPGATNVVTGLTDAMLDSTPLVVITGQVSVSALGTDAFQETDMIGLAQPISKWAIQIQRPEDIAPALAQAFYVASTGRPGPVVLDLTKDAQLGLTSWQYTPCRFVRGYLPRPVLDMEQVRVAADMINAARRPMILAGQGVALSNAEQLLISLAEKADIPVACTLLGLSAIPSGHPLFAGMLGMHGNVAPNYNTNRADLLIAVGMRFDDRVTGDTTRYATQAKILHIDIDASEFDKNIRTDARVHADASEALSALIPLVDKAEHSSWRRSFARHAAAEQSRVVAAAVNPPEGEPLLNMHQVVHCVSEHAPEGAILVTDVGQNQMASARNFRFSHPKSIVTSGALGTMGFGLPAAIGAKMGAPHRTVCLFTGDGGFQMTLQELGTIMQYGTDVKIVILNNNFLGNVRQWQSLFFNNRFSQTPMLNPDFIALARAYAIEGEDVECRNDLIPAVECMFAHQGAYILNVNIDPAAMIFPMTPPGESVDTIMLNQNEYY